MDKPKLSRSTENRIKRTNKRVERISILCASPYLQEDSLTTLFQRASISSVPDGFASSSGLERVSGGGSKDTPTEATVFALNPSFAPKTDKDGKTIITKKRYDPLSEAAKRLEHLLSEVEKTLQSAVLSAQYVQTSVQEGRGRQIQSDPCPIDPADPIEVSGYCRRHYDDWVNHGRPNKQAWKLYRQEAKDANDNLTVPTCPPPGEGQTARRGPWAKVGD